MLACGIEPCAPRPNRRICRLSAAEVIGPALPGDGAGRPDHDVLAQHDIGLGKAVEQAVVDHRPRALRSLLARLEDRHQRAAPGIARLREQRGRAHQPRDMHVMAAGMRDRHRLPVGVCGRDGAGIVERRWPPRTGSASMSARSMTVGPFAVAKQADDAGLPDARRHLIAIVPQMLRREPGRAGFLHRQFGMGMHVLVERLEVWQQAGKVRQQRA